MIDVDKGINFEYIKGEGGFVKSVGMLEPRNVPTWVTY
jgi:hypothetical protein